MKIWKTNIIHIMWSFLTNYHFFLNGVIVNTKSGISSSSYVFSLTDFLLFVLFYAFFKDVKGLLPKSSSAPFEKILLPPFTVLFSGILLLFIVKVLSRSYSW